MGIHSGIFSGHVTGTNTMTPSSTLLTTLLLLVTLTLACTTAATPPATLNANTIKVYTASQLGLNATAAASVFASDAKLTIPLGSPQLLGQEAIMGFYSQFMSALDELVEIPGQKVFNGDTFVSYEKEGQLFFKNGQSQTFFAITVWETDPSSPVVDPASGLEFSPIVEGIITF